MHRVWLLVCYERLTWHACIVRALPLIQDMTKKDVCWYNIDDFFCKLESSYWKCSDVIIKLIVAQDYLVLVAQNYRAYLICVHLYKSWIFYKDFTVEGKRVKLCWRPLLNDILWKCQDQSCYVYFIKKISSTTSPECPRNGFECG